MRFLGWIPAPRRRPGEIHAPFAACVLLFAAACVAPVVAHAQPTPPADGVDLPEAALRVLRRDPNFFTFDRSYVRQAARLKENRRLIREGRLDVSGMSPDEIRQLTVISGTKNIPVLLGKYVDTGAAPISRADLQKELFDGPWPTGTMKQYYSQVSYGNLTLGGTVYDWVTTAHDDVYYAGEVNGFDPDSSHTDVFVTELLTTNDPAVDFSQYDDDGPDDIPNSGDDDGYVDFVAIVQPEIGAECGGTDHNIWSHRSKLSKWSSGEFTTNDPAAGGGFIKVDGYTIMPALSCGGGMIEIGVFCHEFGHGFGLPDLYDWDKKGTGCQEGLSYGLGNWCLMAYGNWNSPTRPALMSAWCKSELGWIHPGVVTHDLLHWPLLSSSVSSSAYKLWTHGDPGSEYFLVEYRTPNGFDDQLAAPGLLIWHVDEGASNNTNECHKHIDLECADQSGTDHTEDADDLDAGTNKGDSGDPFCSRDVFTSTSKPSSDAYDGTNTTVQVKNITACGGSTIAADLIVGESLGNVDLCMRDCPSDACGEPSGCDKFWASPEVYIDNDEDGTSDSPAEGIDNKLFARVRNAGGEIASNVNVAFYFADPAMGQLFPSTGTLIGNANIPQIIPGGSETASVTWNIPSPPPNVSHYCVGVIAENSDDTQHDEFAPNDNDLVQINFQELVAKAGSAVPLAGGGTDAVLPDTIFTTVRDVRVCNPFNNTCVFDVRIGSPPNYDDAVIPSDWTVQLSFMSVPLAPHECRVLHVRAVDNHPVHGDFAVVPLTLLCGDQIAGGDVLRFEIDNVKPKPPCARFRVVEKIPDHDDLPPDDQITISWGKDTIDALGFPETVERWRIYRGSDSHFVPGPGNLLIETCIDEDPTTPDFEHFADIPADPAQQWYKIVAVDRAGNVSTSCATQVEHLPSGADDPRPRSAAFHLSQNQPNPFGAMTQIDFALPRSGPADLTIYSMSGRHVRSLVRGWSEGGDHRIAWDGRDDAGAPMPAGLYVCRLKSQELQQSIRMTLLR